MATLDVSFVTTCIEFSNQFQIVRRVETISQTGRSVITNQVIATAYGTIYPTGDNSLVRQADYELSRKTLTVVTPYRLQQATRDSQGNIDYQPDLVWYLGNEFVVSAVEDYSQYGAGFVVAQLSSMNAINAPLQ